MIKKFLRINLIAMLMFFSYASLSCCAEELNVIENDYDSVIEEMHETITETNDTVNHLDNKNFVLIQDEVDDSMEVEYTIFDNFNRMPKEAFIKSEEPLFARIMKQEITRTDMPSYLLKNETTMFFERGPIRKIQTIGAFSGNLSMNFSSHYDQFTYDSTEYDFGFTQIGALGKFADNQTDFKVLFNLRPSKGLNYMQSFVADAYLVNNRIPHHKVIVGHSRNSTGFEGSMSGYILPLASRSQISRTFGNNRATGAKIIGDYSLVDYSIGASSSDRNFHEFFPGGEFTGWVNLKPLGKTDGRYGKLTIGGGINTGKNRDGYTVGGLYVGYKYKRLFANFECAAADGYNGYYVSDKRASGFYSTIGYKITPKVQIVARYDQFDPDKSKINDLRREITAGVNWFVKGQAIRFIFNYVFCMNQNTPDSHRIVIGTQFLL